KGAVVYPPLAGIAEVLDGHGVALLGSAWVADVDHVVEAFGMDGTVLEYAVTMTPQDADEHGKLDECRRPALRGIITAAPAAATRREARLAGAKRALARSLSLGDAEPELHPMGAPWLRSGEQLARLLPGRPELLATSVELAQECAFTLDLVAPGLPDHP